jgi:histidyl-tRNA synthetase
MRDFTPAVKAQRERVLSRIRASYRAHGFDEIETPVVEDYDRLHSGLGGDNEKLGFSVLKRGLSHDDLAAACREALTMSRETTRAYAEKFSWRACAEDFRRNLQPLPKPEKKRFWRRLKLRGLRRKRRTPMPSL